MTAKVLRTGCIYCRKCNQPYRIYVKEEQICSRKLAQLVFLYFAILIASALPLAILVILDGYFKFRFSQENFEEMLPLANQNIWVGVDRMPDFSERTFSLSRGVRWGVMLPFGLFVFIIVTWLFYFAFNEDVSTRKKLVYVEVREFDADISRIEAKINMKTVLESSLKHKNDNSLFDKLYYVNREARAQKSREEGFVFDGQGLVTGGSMYSNDKLLKDNEKRALTLAKQKTPPTSS